MVPSPSRGVGNAGSRPTICRGIISATGIVAVSTPDDHFTTSPYCCVRVSGSGRIGDRSSCPTIRTRIVSAARVQTIGTVWYLISAPDDHFGAGPHGRVNRSTGGHVRDGSGCPRIIGASAGRIRYCRKSVSSGSYNFARGSADLFYLVG